MVCTSCPRCIDTNHGVVESFKILSSYSLQSTTLKLHVSAPFVSPDTGSTPHDPLVLVPMEKTIRIMNITDFKPRKPPPCPLDNVLAEQIRKLNITTPQPEVSEEGHEEEGTQSKSGPPPTTGNHIPVEVSPEDLFQSVEGWEASVTQTETMNRTTLPDINSCELAYGGKVILGVGNKETLYMWRLVPKGSRKS